MELKEYQRLARRSSIFADVEYRENNILMAALGLAGEAGEICDYLKKVIFHSHELSNDKLGEELGDLLWYIAETASASGLSLEKIAHHNVLKLQRRYPRGFRSEDSINRSE